MSLSTFPLLIAMIAAAVMQNAVPPASSSAPASLSPFPHYVVWTNRPDCSFGALPPSDPRTDAYDSYISSQKFECSALWNHGILIRNVKGPDLGLMLQCQDGRGHFECIAFVKNLTDRRVEIDPAGFWAQEVMPSDKRLARIPAEKLSRSIQRHAHWVSALTAFASAFATQPISGTATGTSGDDYAIKATVPDTAAQSRAAADNADRNRAANEQAASIMEAALERHTLLPENDVAGFVFFEKDKHFSLMRVHLPIDGTDYVFVFTPPAKK